MMRANCELNLPHGSASFQQRNNASLFLSNPTIFILFSSLCFLNPQPAIVVEHKQSQIN